MPVVAATVVGLALTYGTIALVAGAVIYTGYVAYEALTMDFDIGDSSTYKGNTPVYTIEEGKPIARCYGRCKIAGNLIRASDPAETTIKAIIGHSQGPVDEILSWKINNIEWDSLTSVAWWAAAYAGSIHWKNTLLGTKTQSDIQVNGSDLFSLNECAYRGIAHTGFQLTKNTQIGSLGSILVEGRFLKCSPIGVSLVNATYKWTESVAQSGEFHIELAAGGDPSITTPSAVEINESNAPEGTIGSLAVGEWDYGNNDTLGYNTIYVRITADADPDTKDDDYIGYETAQVFSRNNAVVMWDFYRNVEDYSIAELNIEEFTSLAALCDAYPDSGKGGPIRPPGPNNTTVKATSIHTVADYFAPFFAFDGNRAIEGSNYFTSWLTMPGTGTEQRLNVDLGVPVVLTKIVLVNGHNSGAELTSGIQHFVIQGSNTAADLEYTTYADGASGWTNVQAGLTATQYDSADPYKDYEVAAPGTAYRYYSIKIADGHGIGYLNLRDCCFWGRSPRYTFDYNFDSNAAINDAKKLIWQSFNGRVIRSQGKLKPVWDWSTMGDGSGGLTAKTSRHSFTMDNIVKDSFTWSPTKRANKIQVEYLDSSEGFKKTIITEKDDSDIETRGEVVFSSKAFYLTQQDPAARRCKRQLYRSMYNDYQCKLTSLTGGQKLEVYDLVQVTHTLPGWTAKEFIILDKSEDWLGRPTFLLEAYYAGVFDDGESPIPQSYFSALPNPSTPPISCTNITASLVAPGTNHDFDAVNVAFTPPDDPFYSYTEVYISKDDITYYYAGSSSGTDIKINGMGSLYEPGDTVYIKLINVNTAGVAELMPDDYDDSIVITSSIKLANFYAGLNDFWGGNAAIGNAATTIVLGNLDGTVKIALGPSADAISVTGTAPGFIADGTGKVYFGDGADQYFKFDGSNISWKGTNTELTAAGELTVTNIAATGGTIGGWTIGATTLASANITLDEGNDRITVGTIYIDGANERIRTTNYVSGSFGAGFTLEPDLLEVGNIASRGIIRTAVFQKDVVSAVGGNLAVLPADLLNATMSAYDDDFVRITEAGDTRITEAGDTRILEIYAALTIEGNETLSVGDIIRIKDGTYDEWMEIMADGLAPIYDVLRDKAGSYADGSNPEWPKGASVINYGASGKGGILLTSSEANAPYLSMFTHAGAPWTTLTTVLRLGNLNSYAGYVAETYGMAAYIDADNYIKVDATNGIRMSGNIVITNVDAFPGLPSDENLVGYWSLDEGSGAVAYDSSGNDNNGTLIDMEDADWVAGVSGKCLEFDGTDANYITISADVSFTSLDIGSISIWVNADTTDIGFAFGYNNSTTDYFRLGVEGSAKITFVCEVGDVLVTSISSDDNIETGRWYHIVITQDGSNAQMYVDGMAQDHGGQTNSGNWFNDEPNSVFYIGYKLAWATLSFDGLIDEVRIYDTVLTASEIKALFLYPSGNKSPIPATLDQLAEGADYGRILQTSISAGQILLTAGVTGSLPVTNSDAKCTEALADVTADNETFSSEGDMELDDIVGTTKASILQTVVDAGYVKLIRLAADSTERMEITAGGIEGYANNVKNFELASGIAYLGDQSNEHIKLSSSGLQIYDGATLYATYGATTIIGEVGAGKSNIEITGGALNLRTNETDIITLSSTGVASIKVASGGDILMYSEVDNPSKVTYHDDSDVAIGSFQYIKNYGVGAVSAADGTNYFTIGSPTVKWAHVQEYSTEFIRTAIHTAGQDLVTETITAADNASLWSLVVARNSVANTLSFDGVCLYPSSDGNVALGKDDHQFTAGFIKIGNYTGDGGTGVNAQEITGVDFQPRWVFISARKTSITTSQTWMKYSTWGIYAVRIADSVVSDKHINSMDADGFTVDDAETDANPNKLDQVYDYIAIA